MTDDDIIAITAPQPNLIEREMENEITTLRAENERLRAALSELYRAVDNACTGGALNLTAFQHQRNVARAALGERT